MTTSYAEARSGVERLVDRFAGLSALNRKHYNEAATRQEFILPMFGALGWNVTNTHEVSPEEKVSRGFVDFAFRIGSIPRGLPSINLPAFDLAQLKLVILPAIMLAVVGSLDSLLTSLVADAITKTRHNSERELIGQGLGNVLAGMIGGLPGAGATMRTVVNVKSGGRLYLSGLIHALLLLAVTRLLSARNGTTCTATAWRRGCGDWSRRASTRACNRFRAICFPC